MVGQWPYQNCLLSPFFELMRRGIHATPSFITPSMARLALDFLGRGVPEVARSALLTNRAWVGGRWVAATGGNTFPVVNPSNGGLIAEVMRCCHGASLTILQTCLLSSIGSRSGDGRDERGNPVSLRCTEAVETTDSKGIVD